VRKSRIHSRADDREADGCGQAPTLTFRDDNPAELSAGGELLSGRFAPQDSLCLSMPGLNGRKREKERKGGMFRSRGGIAISYPPEFSFSLSSSG